MLSLVLLSVLAAPNGLVSTVPTPSSEVLFNPHMGLYLQYPPLDAKPDEWFMQVCDIAYFRLDWSTLNPEADKLAFDEYFKPIFDTWVGKLHKRVAFRVMSQNMHSRQEYVSPKWIFDAGVPSVEHVGLYTPHQVDPAFWSPQYLAVQDKFIAQLGAYLEGKPGVEFVDIGGIGEWGEMHLARWTPQQFEATGYTEAGYVAAYRRMIDAYTKAFPHTPIFLNVGGQNHLSINDYAAIHGVHFRQDGLMPQGASYDCGGWLYGPYSRRGVKCMFEFHSSYHDMQAKHWDLRQTFDKGFAAPISYLNTNLFGGAGYRQAPQDARDLLTEAARKIGYRFLVTRVDHPAELHLYADRGSRMPVLATWRNDGVAPCYDSLALDWSLADAQGQVVSSLRQYPSTPTTRWWPGEEQAVTAMLRLPAGVKPGPLTLRVKAVLPETGQVIKLGLAGGDDPLGYPLATLNAVAAEGAAPPAHRQDFEADGPTWTAVAGITAKVDAGEAHAGQHALLVEGTAKQAWNYVQHRLAEPVVPGGRYRFSVWMKVDACSSKTLAPYAKLAVNGADNKWLDNFGTNRYDLAKLGTWQELVGYADLPLTAATADIAIEKGDLESAVTVKLRLDDVIVELVEGM